MVCTDRQLSPAQLAEGFSTRIGVARAVRALGGPPTLQNLFDYVQRELVPGVRNLTSKLNEVYLPAKENASSANPLTYQFSTSVAAGDPTTGRMKVNASPQNTATVWRVSETNQKQSNVQTWLTVMQSGTTTPLAVVTLSDAADPGRFIRANLTALVDQGAYWDLTVTVVESSHPDPFVETESVLISYIAGVAAGGVSPATSIAAIRAISAGTQMATSGTISFANNGFITFGMTNSSVITAQHGALRLISAGTTNLVNADQLSFANGNGFSFSLNGSTISGSFAALKTVSLATYATALSSNVSAATDVSLTANPVVFQHLGTEASLFLRANVLWRMSSNSLVAVAPQLYFAGAGIISANNLSFINVNGISFNADSSLDANFGRVVQITASVDPRIGVVSHVGGNVQSSVTRLAFSNASGVTWSASTAASAVTMLASVNDQSIGLVSHIGGNVVSSVSRLAFSNASNVTFSLSTAAGAATLIASVAAAAAGNALHLTNAASSVSATQLLFSNANGFSWLLSTAASAATLSGSFATTFLGAIAGGTQTATSGTIVFSNSGGVSFGLSGSTRMTASVDPEIGLVSHIGGNSVSDVTRLAFSNASNVTFSLSTAANAATLLASVNAGGGGFSVTAGTTNVTDAGISFDDVNRMQFGMNGRTITGNPMVQHSASDNSVNATRIVYGSQTGVSVQFQMDTGASIGTLRGNIVGPDMSYFMNVTGRDFGNAVIDAGNSHGYVFPVNAANPFPGRMTISTLDMMFGGATFSSTAGTASWGFTMLGGLYSLNNSTRLSLINSFSSGFSSTTINSTLSASRNNSFGASKWVTVHSSLWSSQPVMSHGVQYWMFLLPQRVGASAIISNFGIQPIGGGFAGTMGSTVTAVGRQLAFIGRMGTAGVPVSIANTHLVQSNTDSNFQPIFQFRGNIVN